MTWSHDMEPGHGAMTWNHDIEPGHGAMTWSGGEDGRNNECISPHAPHSYARVRVVARGGSLLRQADHLTRAALRQARLHQIRTVTHEPYKARPMVSCGGRTSAQQPPAVIVPPKVARTHQHGAEDSGRRPWTCGTRGRAPTARLRALPAASVFSTGLDKETKIK